MKSTAVRQSRSAPAMSPKGRVRKSSSAERKEKLKVEAALRNLVGSEEDASQLDLVLAAIAYIRELRQQLDSDQENHLPEGFEKLFEKTVKA